MKPMVYVVVLCAQAGGASAQVSRLPALDMTGYLKTVYEENARRLMAVAETMPAEDYGLKLSDMPGAPTFGIVITSGAAGIRAACAVARDERTPRTEFPGTAKAAVLNDLQAAMTYCDEVFASLTEQTGGEWVAHRSGRIPRAAALMDVLTRSAESYGTGSTFLRAKNIVPPLR